MPWPKLPKSHHLTILLACAAGITMVSISEASYWRSEATLSDLRDMNEARAQIEELTRSVVDAEAGQRGYLLTRRDEYLEPYHQALGRIGVSFQALDAHFGQQPEPREMVQRLRALTDTKLSELALTMRLLD